MDNGAAVSIWKRGKRAPAPRRSDQAKMSVWADLWAAGGALSPGSNPGIGMRPGIKDNGTVTPFYYDQAPVSRGWVWGNRKNEMERPAGA